MDTKSTNNAIDEIIGLRFNGDDQKNALTKAEQLIKLKGKWKKDYFETRKAVKKKESDLKQSEDVQAGRNAEVRTAILEGLKFEDELFDRLEYLERVISIVNDVQDHNRQVIEILKEFSNE